MTQKPEWLKELVMFGGMPASVDHTGLRGCISCLKATHVHAIISYMELYCSAVKLKTCAGNCSAGA